MFYIYQFEIEGKKVKIAWYKLPLPSEPDFSDIFTRICKKFHLLYFYNNCVIFFIALEFQFSP